ncbi:PucR family transcriptional regulator [Leucobacter aridicollis]|uniref:PucR family transcriptional regulator n=1 Tax=Leucobacter aridicollis TaxID=283878 RepID=UPI002103361A|nr:helix-turn-helix domain-containing protein [Leucobacter aridicollis]UTX51815.1 helix-turn-helix domain-containing protein [Leucobacter aridicollis]
MVTTPRTPQATLDLASLLAHPDSGGVTHIAGPATGTWQNLTVDEPESAAEGLLVATTAFPSTSWQQDALVRRVRDRGFAALALTGARLAGPGARKLADRLELTLLDVDRPIALARAGWQLQQARDALTIDYVRKVAQAFEYPAADLADLLGHLCAAIGHGIALIDSGRTVQQAGGVLSPELHAGLSFTPWISVARVGDAAATSVRVDSSTRRGLRLAVFDAGLSDVQLRALSTVAEIMMPAVAARILIDELDTVNDASSSADLLRAFIELRGVRDPDVHKRMAERGWRTAGYHLGFQFTARTRVDPVGLLRAVSHELTAVSVESRVALSGGGVLGWLTFTDPPASSEVERFAGALNGVHQQLRRTRDVALGIGSLQSGETGLARTLNEAGDAAKIATSRSSSGYLVRVDSLGLEQLLLAWTGTDTFLPAAESLLAPLLTEAPELLDTLAAYFDHESGIQATAAALGLHRNTVSQRVQRAQELVGADLTSPETRLALHLACRAVLAPRG